ncbi:spore germination cell wall hydrolase CwlJ-like protein [Novosphingobium sp. PhB165]|uniref:cell wall hydrolase n=1 Tax=Novosphingobium sp. PhB165 TaxID=2485105 RepID=UPI0010DE5C53|nr:cell wall hydrolase [Novosphingobium sp. PhB165]TCM16435.1 spore germination cell wall hydrolase CwlJ-like protein [Novosphingobium sp. PhB165]
MAPLLLGLLPGASALGGGVTGEIGPVTRMIPGVATGLQAFALPLPSTPLPALPEVVPPGMPDDAAREAARRINASIPFASGRETPAAPFRFVGSQEDRLRAIDCIASAEYYEAGGDLDGQRAVAQVVLNRMRHPAFPASACGVVFQGAERATGCQFTFTCDGAMARRPMPWLWDKARAIAASALNGAVFAPVGHATHYHTDWVAPPWSGELDKIARVGPHLFFRWRGGWGSPAAFRQRVDPGESTIAPLTALATGQEPDPLAAGTGADLIPAVATALADPPDPTSPDVIGVDLRGARLKLLKPSGDAFGLLLPRTAPGSFGSLALDLCRGRSFCEVTGWVDSADIPRSYPIPTSARRSMAFLYLRDQASHREMTAWDCKLFPRNDPTECLRKVTAPKIVAASAPAVKVDAPTALQ